jgi:glutaminyl-peptide cyclotransferase
VRLLVVVLVLTVAVGIGFAVLAATDSIPLLGAPDEGADVTETTLVDRFDEDAAFDFLRRQVELGPRPAGSAASRRLGEILRDELPSARFQPVPGGLRNVIGEVPGRDPDRFVVVGAHYDTKDLPGFVGANDGAAGTAVVLELARSLEPRELEPTVVFALFDGEESPRGTPDEQFAAEGLRGSKVAARTLAGAEAMINVDFVGDERLSLPREANSDPQLWEGLRAAAERVGYGEVYPPETQPAILDDHIPFKEAGVPAIDLIDFEFDCFHRPCDDLSAVAPESLDAAGEPLLELLRGVR